MEPLVEVFQRLQFLKPASDLRRLLLLGNILTDERLSQRRLAERAGLSPAVVNGYLSRFIQQGLVTTTPVNDRDLQYSLTPLGIQQVAEMRVGYMRETFILFSRAKIELKNHLAELQKRSGIRKIVLYPAGEVTELVIHAVHETPLNVVGVLDDDPNKQGESLFGFPMIARSSIEELDVEGILITTFRYRDILRGKVRDLEEQGVKVMFL